MPAVALPPPIRAARFLVDPSTSECDRVQLMSDLVSDGVNDPVIQALAKKVYAQAVALAAQCPVHTGDWFARILAMEALRAAQVPQYIDNDGDQEWMQQASYTLAHGGECKALSVLFVSLCTALGLKAQIVWITQTGKDINHVTAMVYLDGMWMWGDASIRGAMLGESPYHAVDRLGAYNVVGGQIKPSGQARGHSHDDRHDSRQPWAWSGWNDLWYGWPPWWWDMNYPYLYYPYQTVYARPQLLAA